ITPPRGEADMAMFDRCTRFAVVVLLVGGLSTWASPARAHLSLIREGKETPDLANPENRFGEAVAAGDFNGDGYQDLATGAPWDAGSFYHSGTVTVLWGSALGLTHVGRQRVTESSVGGDSDNADHLFGSTLAA